MNLPWALSEFGKLLRSAGTIGEIHLQNGEKRVYLCTVFWDLMAKIIVIIPFHGDYINYNQKIQKNTENNEKKI